VITKRKKYLIICPKNKQFKNIIACAAGCPEHLKCKEYRLRISLETLELYVAKHPEYEIIGEIMAERKVQSNEKKYWIIKEDKTISEVAEKEIINNPQKFIGKEIWERPPFKYELVISLKKVKA
jgi:hypothetical protein